MWLFLSSRLRTWVLLAVALPVARGLVHRLSTAAESRSATATSTRLLQRADSGLGAVSNRLNRRRGRRRS